ncbi:MAG: hypothetical protein LBD99_04335 [Candidatus Margulisbacteria bacterium]|jgi:hypothetical protein|nr:hypothetical protein [Candidatus Margulisiibacteriota bacterium]
MFTHCKTIADANAQTNKLKSLREEWFRLKNRLHDLRILAEVTGSINIEAYRNIFLITDVENAMRELGIPDARHILFEPPLVPRQGYCRLRSTTNNIKHLIEKLDETSTKYKEYQAKLDEIFNKYKEYQTKFDETSTKYKESQAKLDEISKKCKEYKAQLEKTEETKNLLANRRVNIELNATKQSIAKLEIQLIEKLIRAKGLGDCQSILSKSGDGAPGKVAQAFLHTYLRASRRPFINNLSYIGPQHYGMIPNILLYYENIDDVQTILANFAGLGLEQTFLQSSLEHKTYFNIFFEQVGNRCLPRRKIIDEYKKAFTEMANKKLQELTEQSEKEKLLQLRKDFYDYFKEQQALRAEEEIEKLGPKTSLQLQRDFTAYMENAALENVTTDNPFDYIESLQKGQKYYELNKFIFSTNFAEKGKSIEIRRKIDAQYEDYFAEFTGPEHKPVAELLKPEILEKLRKTLTPSMKEFVNLPYDSGSEMVAVQQGSVTKLLSMLYALYMPADTENKLRRQSLEANEVSLYTEPN